MSFSVCMFFPRNEKEQDQWDYVLSHWKPEKLYLLGAGVLPHLNNLFKDAICIETLADLPLSSPLVLMAPILGRFIQGNESLIEFNHPHNAIYMFGPNHINLKLDHEEFGGRVPDHMVYVPVDTHHEMYNWTVGSVTLYDRKVKNG